MKKNFIIGLTILSLLVISSCTKYLDVNTNPNAPQKVSSNLFLATILAEMSMGYQIDGIINARYSQMWARQTNVVSENYYERMGDAESDANTMLYRTVYWNFGYNLIYMMEQAEAEERWDVLGVGYLIKAWGWQQLTDLHSDITIQEAFNMDLLKYKYDTQEFAYEEVNRLLLKAIEYLSRTDGAVSASYLAQGDPIYKGDRLKWKRFAYGLLAQSRSHLSNKSAIYNPDEVMTYVDSAFISNADDALFPYTGTRNNTMPYIAPGRDNLTLYRQTDFIVGLLDGTVYGMVNDSLPDPRISRMLAWSRDSTYQGVRTTYGLEGALAKQPMNPYRYTGKPTLDDPGIYIFNNTGKVPLMTYSQLQFIKAEAAYLKGDKLAALEAYNLAVTSHVDFVNRNTSEVSRPGVNTISVADRNALLSVIVPANPNDLTLSHIMGQKYIAQWGWGFIEAWTDLRRYHYTDLDPVTGEQVFPNFTIPSTDRLNGDNQGKPIYRIRPRYASEYVWNLEEVERIGGKEKDYHTRLMWIFEND